MPINYPQALHAIRHMGSKARDRDARLDSLREEALGILHGAAGDEARWMELVAQNAQLHPRLRCARPSTPAERLDGKRAPASAQPEPAILFAADGSQVYPDRHAAVEFAAVNSGGIRWAPGEVPREHTRTELLFRADLDEDESPFNDAAVALRRDLAERAMLLTMAQAENRSPLPVLAFMDGPLELYTQDRNSRIYRQILPRYQDVLRGMAALGMGLAGYIDKAGSAHLVRLLELIAHPESGAHEDAKPLFPLRDADLMEALLGPGERSAVLALQSPTAQEYPAPVGPHFFYLNVGRPGRAHIARVEIPGWVAEEPAQVERIHHTLLGQIRQMGSADPYPYLIHRAHEIAAVGLAEKEQLETMISAELRRQGARVGVRSAKQAAKEAGRNS